MQWVFRGMNNNWSNLGLNTSTTVREDYKLVIDTVMCEVCGKNITKEIKYKNLNDSGWKCKKCYFN